MISSGVLALFRIKSCERQPCDLLMTARMKSFSSFFTLPSTTKQFHKNHSLSTPTFPSDFFKFIAGVSHNPTRILVPYRRMERYLNKEDSRLEVS